MIEYNTLVNEDGVTVIYHPDVGFNVTANQEVFHGFVFCEGHLGKVQQQQMFTVTYEGLSLDPDSVISPNRDFDLWLKWGVSSLMKCLKMFISHRPTCVKYYDYSRNKFPYLLKQKANFEEQFF